MGTASIECDDNLTYVYDVTSPAEAAQKCLRQRQERGIVPALDWEIRVVFFANGLFGDPSSDTEAYYTQTNGSLRTRNGNPVIDG